MGKEADRLLALEGLRGLAAIMVVIFHFLAMFYPVAFYGTDSVLKSIQNSPIDDNLYGFPPMVLLSGVFAVAIFFVLSGFVLSVGYFKTGDEGIVRKLATKRYLRLMIPALVIVMLSWLILTLGLSANVAVLEVTQSGWLRQQWMFEPNFFDALSQGLWGIFTTTGNHYYNAVLWTMVYEFIGSFIVFGVLLLFGRHDKRWMVYLLLMLFTFQTWFLPFIVGMWFADLYVNKRFFFKEPSVLFGTTCLVLGLLFGGYPIGDKTVGTFYETLTVPALTSTVNTSIYLTLGASFIILAALTLPWLSGFLGSRHISGLGKYTFSLYLVHKPVLLTVGAAIFILLVNNFHFGFHIAAFLSAISVIPFLIIASVIFYHYVDSPAIQFSGIFAKWFLATAKNKDGLNE